MALYNREPAVIRADFGAGEGEIEIYVWPMSLEEMEKLEQAQNQSNVQVLVTSLIVRARNKDKGKLFTSGDAQRIMRKFDPDEVVRVVTEMSKYDRTDEPGN